MDTKQRGTMYLPLLYVEVLRGTIRIANNSTVFWPTVSIARLSFVCVQQQFLRGRIGGVFLARRDYTFRIERRSSWAGGLDWQIQGGRSGRSGTGQRQAETGKAPLPNLCRLPSLHLHRLLLAGSHLHNPR